jgi:predicted metal-dependent TIM-barrel fold hydrolase
MPTDNKRLQIWKKFKRNFLNSGSMECFDTHIHSEGKGITELKAMAEAGIKHVISCAYYPVVPSYSSTLIDMFRKLTSFEVERGKKAGLELIPAVGVHPRCICRGWEKALKWVEENAEVIGEIGLECASDVEVEVLSAHLGIAKKLDLPCIVHTPKNNKLKVTEKVLKIVDASGIVEELVVIDHATPKTVEEILKKGYYAGLTVQPGKISVEEVISIVEKHGFEKFVLNSDTGFNDFEALTVVETANALKEKFDEKDVKKVAIENGRKIFKK